MGKYLKTYTDDELQKMAAHYFKNVKTIIATQDGQFFHDNPSGMNHASSHSRENKLLPPKILTEKGVDKEVNTKLEIKKQPKIGSKIEKEADKVDKKEK